MKQILQAPQREISVDKNNDKQRTNEERTILRKFYNTPYLYELVDTLGQVKEFIQFFEEGSQGLLGLPLRIDSPAFDRWFEAYLQSDKFQGNEFEQQRLRGIKDDFVEAETEEYPLN